MWFKNLQIYRLPPCWGIGIDNLRQQLERGMFAKCASNQPMSRGWVAPRNDGNLVYSIGKSQWLLALRTEERILPSSAVNLEASERAEALKEQHGYAPGRKQMKEIKERIIEEFMPRAFVRQRTTLVWVDPYDGWLTIDTSTQGKSEEVIKHLRNCLDEFQLKALRTNISPTAAMADWLAGGDPPAGFTIDFGAELQSVSEDRATVKYAREPLDPEQVKEHLSRGKLPKKLNLTWDDRISFVLTDNLDIKRLSFLALLKNQAEKNAENAEEQFDADFALMTGELSRFIPQMIEALGGEVFDLADQGSTPKQQ